MSDNPTKWWNGLTDTEKIARFQEPEASRWVRNAKGQGDPRDMPRYVR